MVKILQLNSLIISEIWFSFVIIITSSTNSEFETVFTTSLRNNLHNDEVFVDDRPNLVFEFKKVLTGIITDVFNYNYSFNCFKINAANASSAILFCIFNFVSKTCISKL